MIAAGLNPNLFLLDVEQLLAGGIVVRTPIEVTKDGSLLAETVIQPNGDVVTKLDPTCLSSDVWPGHSQQVQLVLNRYRIFMRGIRAFTHWSMLVVFLIAAAAATLKAWIVSALLSLVPVILSLALRWALSRWLKKLIV